MSLGTEKAARKPSAGLKPGLADTLAGEAEAFLANLSPHLPSELIGGSVPHVPGTEDEAVWNAAAQACGTECVHYTYTVEDGKCWYLACPSHALASDPDSWCPLASALPGNSEYWDRETVYLYEHEGLSSALRWDQETGRMQVFLGATRTLLPKIQSMDANFVTINPEIADVVPWKNRALRTEQLSRAAGRSILLSGILMNFIILFFLGAQYLWTIALHRNLDSIRESTDKATTDLMLSATKSLQSDLIKHMVNMQELADALAQIDGILVRYEISKEGGPAEWEALVPQSFSGGTDVLRGKVEPVLEPDGKVRLKGKIK